MSVDQPIPSIALRHAEAERLMALSSERSRELTVLRERARSLRSECGDLEEECQLTLRRLLVAAEAVGAPELRLAVRRELAAIDRES